MPDASVVILAGGRATRFPGKLDREIDGTPMLLRVYERLRGTRSVFVAGNGFSGDLDARLDCPLLLDRWPGRGPLAAFVSACGEIATARVFAIAADLPNVDAALLDELERACQDGDEAVVPAHGENGIEPLAALYDRAAVLERGYALLTSGHAAMRDLLHELRVRYLPVANDRFVNVNTPADLERVP
jgi:molybdopterin-guanine dinucleotide biosynthesis protein A